MGKDKKKGGFKQIKANSAYVWFLDCTGLMKREDPLLQAARKGDLDSVKYYVDSALQDNTEILKNTKTKSGENAFHLAAEEGHLHVAQWLKENTAIETDSPTDSGQTPLMRACYKGRADMAKWLLEQGANVNHVNQGGHTPLHRCAYKGHVATVKVLLAAGADVEAKDGQGRTPLSRAEEKGKADVVQALKEHTGNFTAVNAPAAVST